VSSKKTRKAVFFMIVSPFLESCLGGTSKGSTKSLVERGGRKLHAIYDFNLIEKHVRGNTAIPLDVNELTPQVIDDSLDGSLGETPDQPFVGSDLFGGTTSHAVSAQVDHFANASFPINAPPSRLSLASTAGSSMPSDLFVHNNLLTIFIYLDDRITPTQLRFNMNQLARNFRLDWITPSQQLI
jgi:hypothetical protein